MPLPDQFSTEATKGAVAAVGAAAAALTLNQWVAIGTGLYVVVQMAYLLRKWWREEKDWSSHGRRGRRS